MLTLMLDEYIMLFFTNFTGHVSDVSCFRQVKCYRTVEQLSVVFFSVTV